ncbi:MAG TPA: hypothetical protein PK062_05495, partial [Clostridia bacterium]|nr:hypothetical protein [Clostridia bacterium]
KILCGFLSDLKVLEAALKYERTDVKSLALLLAARGSLREFWRIMSDELTNGAGFGEAWRRHRCELMLNEDIGAIADGFAEHFGSNDAETELSRLEGTLKQLSEKEKTQCACFTQKSRLAVSLSALLGAAAALMII